MTALFTTAFIYLAAAVLIVPLSKRLGLGSVLGYLLAGILIGPTLHLVGQETHDVQHVAESGIREIPYLLKLPQNCLILRRDLPRSKTHRSGSRRLDARA